MKLSTAKVMRLAVTSLGLEADNDALVKWIAERYPRTKIKTGYLPVLVSTARAHVRKHGPEPAIPEGEANGAPAAAGTAALDPEGAVAVKDILAVRDLKTRLGASRIRSILDLLGD